MYCTNCGTIIDDGECFCSNCGEKVDMTFASGKRPSNNRSMNNHKRNYTLGDLGKDGVPGSKIAAFGIVITLISMVAGSMGMLTTIIAIFLLIIARVKGFKSIWISVALVSCIILFFRASSIYDAEISLENALFINNLFGFFSLF